MRNVRIKNDISFSWTIQKNGQAVAFDALKTKVYIVHQSSGLRISVDNLAITDNVVTGIFRGKSQKRPGPYMLLLTENDGEDEVFSVDHRDFICLVPHTDETGGDDCSNVTTTTVEATDDVTAEPHTPVITATKEDGVVTIYVDGTAVATVADGQTLPLVVNDNGTGIQNDKSVASGERSVALGFGNEASGLRSVAIGNNNTVTGMYSFAEGENNIVYGSNSHAEGAHNTIGEDPAETSTTITLAHVEGQYNTVTNSCEHAEGTYNVSTKGVTLSSCGCGSRNARGMVTEKNAYEITKEGKIYMLGIGGYDGTNVTADGVKDVATVIAELTS